MTVMLMDAVFCSGGGFFFPAMAAAGRSMDSRHTRVRRWMFMASTILQPARANALTHWRGMSGCSRLQLDHDGSNQYGHNSRYLHDPQGFTDKKHRKQNGKYRFQATGDNRPCGIKVFQSAEIKHVRQRHGETGKSEQKSPLRPAE